MVECQSTHIPNFIAIHQYSRNREFEREEVPPWGDQGGIKKKRGNFPYGITKGTSVPNFTKIKLDLGEVRTYFDVLLSDEVCAFNSVMSPGRLFKNGCHGFQSVNSK